MWPWIKRWRDWAMHDLWNMTRSGPQPQAVALARIVSATGTYSAAATNDSTPNWSAAIATFKAATPGPRHKVIMY